MLPVGKGHRDACVLYLLWRKKKDFKPFFTRPLAGVGGGHGVVEGGGLSEEVKVLEC